MDIVTYRAAIAAKNVKGKNTAIAAKNLKGKNTTHFIFKGCREQKKKRLLVFQHTNQLNVVLQSISTICLHGLSGTTLLIKGKR
jgi:hypothetical protein